LRQPWGEGGREEEEEEAGEKGVGKDISDMYR
jgi:hypothetical protein